MFLNTPPVKNDNITYFIGSGNAADGDTIYTWTKPTNATMVSIIAIGGGGGGGGGVASNSTTGARYGGGGGGSASISTLIIPAIYLPDTIYLLVAFGGAGGALNVAGSDGATTLISDGVGGTILSATGGAAGTAGASGSPGGAGGAVFTGGPYTLSGTFASVAGVSGGAGATSAAAAANVTPMSGTIVTGGAGGCSFNSTTLRNGGTISATVGGFLPAVSGDGVWSWAPMCGTGGAGKTADSTTLSYDGAIGCGGGGGAAGNATGGTQLATVGGDGGPGLVIISTW